MDGRFIIRVVFSIVFIYYIFSAKVSVVTSRVNDTYRKTEEERLIHYLGTFEPRGMNVRFHSFPVSIVTP